ncbi:hypothetical protein CH063_07783 [Colletotrichum higginsianum]|uniref:Uncharacterized protein n=1 Tax=Colletotrichum higginsianum (strain IMI 349063) TaxID=759273 RepID=H1V7E7_COLHI|nr:hypothetical protein CH63R_01636 [Colletotrichum higginsianum IMI 349063]OBR16456.1 hypothetical protein CH63R_01636 [Colletotrichum higginsianum IMI 349063]GJC91309.1 hypothetical protein ColKHC_00135 [Colletotrichum higginsianum]CCF36149.1 hypothetical protein CH063_07783 [Colletotrichum higginsianum]
MHFFQIVVGFAAAVSAIDIQKHFGQTCGGNYRVCRGLNPNVCCVGATAESLLFRYIPSEWRIECRGYTGGDCRDRRSTIFSAGATSICMQSGGILFTGAGYGFVNRKRAPDSDETCTDAELQLAADGQPQNCQSSQEPDTLVLVDGSEFAIAADPNVTSAADIPDEFKSIEIV